MKYKLTFLLLLLCLSFNYCSANNLKIENVELKDQNSVANTVKIEFDISWENSWRTSAGPKNYDAVWIFIKFRTNSGIWSHAKLSYSNGISDGHTAPSGSTIHTSSDQIGCFLFRNANGSGNNDWDDIQLIWEYNALDDDAQVDVQVFAMEMVYIPEGLYYLGGGAGNEINKFFRYPSSSSSYQVTSESAITIGSNTGNLNYVADNANAGDGLGPLPSSFPKGFKAFYTMKYELTEGQWVAFFNSLNPSQKTSRDITSAAGKNSDAVVDKNTISWLGGSNPATSSAPERSMSFLSPSDFMSYMDWSGLRPMTELEYEKTCRGPVVKVPNDYAWGNANIVTAIQYNIENDGSPNEYINNMAVSTGNANYSTTSSVNGPYRVGVFAASAVNKNREETGASYYGVMELSGNLYERVVTIGTLRGRDFTGLHGNGIISSSSGNSTVSNWPIGSTGDGFSYRGGSWANQSNILRVSDRQDGSSLISNGNNRLGSRCARTAEL